MTPLRNALVALLLGTTGCGILSGAWEDDPSVVNVYVLARSDGGQVSLEIASTGAEGDWTYGAFAQARLDGLRVTTPDGTPVHVGTPTFTPASDHGGTFQVPLPPLSAEVQKVKASGEFIGLDEAGEVVMRRDFDTVVGLEG